MQGKRHCVVQRNVRLDTFLDNDHGKHKRVYKKRGGKKACDTNRGGYEIHMTLLCPTLTKCRYLLLRLSCGNSSVRVS